MQGDERHFAGRFHTVTHGAAVRCARSGENDVYGDDASADVRRGRDTIIIE
jgi:hypothetical protein